MRSRCLFDGPNSKNHKGKGITICKEWANDYNKFHEDMGERPRGKTLDRIDGKGNYEKSNCRWATGDEQARNKCSNAQITKDGVTKPLSAWAEDLGLSKRQLAQSYKRHSSYRCTSFEEIFHKGCLLSLRTSKRINSCRLCDRTTSCKWREYGKLCNTCYGREQREVKKELAT